MSVFPIEIRRRISEERPGEDAAGLGLDITWSTGDSSFLPSETLRRNCPCATCQELRGDTSHAKPLTGGKSSLQVLSASVEEETNLLEVQIVGNYAIGILWGDNHSTGIFSYGDLYSLASNSN